MPSRGGPPLDPTGRGKELDRTADARPSTGRIRWLYPPGITGNYEVFDTFRGAPSETGPRPHYEVSLRGV